MQYTIKFTLYPLHIAFIYLTSIAVAETVTALFNPWIGLSMHVAVLTAIIVHSVIGWYNPSRRFLLSLLFAPIIRMLSLSLPLTDFPLIYWFLITSIPLFALILMVVRVLEFRWDEVGLTLRQPWVQAAVAPTGLLFGVMEYFILRPDPLIPTFSWQALIVPSLILLISTGFFEELAFRGIMQTTAMEVLGRSGVLYIALIFAALHIGYQSPLDVLFVFGVGAFFGWVVMQTGSILGVTLAHGLTNIVLFLVMPFLFAGYSLQQPPVLNRTPIATGVSNVPILSESTVESSEAALRVTRPLATQPAHRSLALPTETVSTVISGTVDSTAVPEASPTIAATRTISSTATQRLIDKLTVTSTPSPTSTLVPATHTASPTHTPTQAPTQPPTQTPTETASPTPSPTLSPTPLPTSSPTPTFTPQPEVIPLQPEDGFTSDSFVTFEWQLNVTPAKGQRLELIFWKPGQDPVDDGIGLIVDGKDSARVNLRQLDIMLRDAFEPGDYQWGLALIETEPAYKRLRYLGGGQSIRFVEALE